MRLLVLSSFTILLPLLGACTQTTTAPTPQAPAGATNSAVHAALADAQATRERHSSEATAMNVMSIFDPIGVTDIAEPIMKAQQQQELDEKYRRVDAEVQKTVAEAEAIKAQHAARSSDQGKARARKPAPSPAQ